MVEQGSTERNDFPGPGVRICGTGELGRRPRAQAGDDFHKQERNETAVQSEIPVQEREASHPGSAEGQERKQAMTLTGRSENL